MAIQLYRDLANAQPRNESECRHPHCIPEILLAEDVHSIQVPSPGFEIVRVTKNGKPPGEDETKPSNESMMSLENIVMGIPQPGNRTHDDDDDSDVGNSPNDEDRLGGDRIVSEVVHNFEYEPASTRQRTTAVNASKMLKNRRAAEPPPQRWPLSEEGGHKPI